MKRPTIYLCGPIQGCTAGEASNWRNTAASLLAPQFGVLDPLRDKYNPDGAGFREDNAPGTYAAHLTSRMYTDREIVMRDLQDIRQCRAVLRYFEKPSEGSAHESAYAASMDKPLVLVTQLPVNELSPWTRFHAVKILTTVEEACSYIKSFWLYPDDPNPAAGWECYTLNASGRSYHYSDAAPLNVQSGDFSVRAVRATAPCWSHEGPALAQSAPCADYQPTEGDN